MVALPYDEGCLRTASSGNPSKDNYFILCNLAVRQFDLSFF